MELDRIVVLAVVAKRVVHLKHLCLTFWNGGLLHGGHVPWCLVTLLSAKDARLQVLLSVHQIRVTSHTLNDA